MYNNNNNEKTNNVIIHGGAKNWPTQPPTLSGIDNEYWPKCSDALWLHRE